MRRACLDRKSGCIELHPHPVRSGDLDHPDELRIDLDPVPGVGWDDVRRVALEVKGFLENLVFADGRKPAARAACTSMYASNRAGRLLKFVARPSPYREQSSGACQLWPARNGGRKSVMASFLTTTRTRRTGRRARPIQCVRCQMLAFRLLLLGRSSRLRSRGLHHLHGSGAFRENRRSACRHKCRTRLARKIAGACRER